MSINEGGLSGIAAISTGDSATSTSTSSAATVAAAVVICPVPPHKIYSYIKFEKSSFPTGNSDDDDDDDDVDGGKDEGDDCRMIPISSYYEAGDEKSIPDDELFDISDDDDDDDDDDDVEIKKYVAGAIADISNHNDSKLSSLKYSKLNADSSGEYFKDNSILLLSKISQDDVKILAVDSSGVSAMKGSGHHSYINMNIKLSDKNEEESSSNNCKDDSSSNSAVSNSYSNSCGPSQGSDIGELIDNDDAKKSISVVRTSTDIDIDNISMSSSVVDGNINGIINSISSKVYVDIHSSISNNAAIKIQAKFRGWRVFNRIRGELYDKVINSIKNSSRKSPKVSVGGATKLANKLPSKPKQHAFLTKEKDKSAGPSTVPKARAKNRIISPRGKTEPPSTSLVATMSTTHHSKGSALKAALLVSLAAEKALTKAKEKKSDVFKFSNLLSKEVRKNDALLGQNRQEILRLADTVQGEDSTIFFIVKTTLDAISLSSKAAILNENSCKGGKEQDKEKDDVVDGCETR